MRKLGYELQYLTLETIMGPKEIPAPEGWQFDKTAITVWSRLLELAKQKALSGNILKRDEYARAQQFKILALVLSNSLGKATTYWEWAAVEIVDYMTEINIELMRSKREAIS